MIRARATAVRDVGHRLLARFRESQRGTVHRALTIDDGSLAVTGNYLKVAIPPGKHRNEWVNLRISEAGPSMRGELVD